MSRIAGFVLFCLMLLGLPVTVGYLSDGQAGLSYATSASMEPAILAGDGFLVRSAQSVAVGDVIVFRPLKLKAERVVHRIISETTNGFVTKGDNAPSADQDAGEPPVLPDRIIGRVVTFHGNPVRIPGIGNISLRLQEVFQQHLRTLFLFALGIGVALTAWDALNLTRYRPLRIRWRVFHVYLLASALAFLGVVAATVIASGVRSAQYLSSMDPGDLPNHVRAWEGGVVTVVMENRGLVPIYHFSEALEGMRVVGAPATINPRSKVDLKILTPPRNPGWYRAYVRVYHYPALMPRSWVAVLHARSPHFAILGNAAVAGLVLWLLSRLVDLWVPLSARRQSTLSVHTRRVARIVLQGRRMP